MVVLQSLLQSRITAAAALATDLGLLRDVAAGVRPPVLHVYSLSGDVLSLGRYRLAPLAAPTVDLQRRIGGGRVLPSGDGFVHVSLLLPRRGALLAAGETLSADRLMNRYARGVLGACRALRLEAIYPGRDLLTLGGRAVAAIALEVDDRGASLFEALLALDRSFATLPGLLDRADPDGVVVSPLLGPAETTTLASESAAALDFAAVASALAASYGAYFGATVQPLESAGGEGDGAAAADWLEQRRQRDGLDRRARAWTQLGLVEVYYSLRAEVIEDVMLCGDFIANSPAVRRLEQALRGCARDSAQIDRVLAGVLHEPQDYLLGVASLAVIRDAIVGGETG